MIKKHLTNELMLKEIFLKVLEGDCETAIGAHAVIDGDEIILEAELFSLDGNSKVL